MLALVLAVAGAVLWRAGRVELDLAEAARALGTLRFERAVAAASTVPSGALARRTAWSAAAADLAARTQVLAAYWAGDDAALVADPFLAANAAFRALREEGGDWQPVVGRLDGLVKQYADVVRADPTNDLAAFNYEFAVRYRLAVASVRQPVPPIAAGLARPTLHGLPGAPPKGTDMKQFKTIVPMRPDERNEAEEAAKGQVRVRKG